ncbi:hypothetical protein [Oryzisolibacter propanilivorax]|nr:hypothetical protein [Oryzisolibacter propanilivorax]
MENRSIAQDIRNTGFALRDWLGPYYMLGGAVAFGIAMLTLLDPSGWLVRGVGAALLTVTLLAWARHFHLHWRQPAPPLVQPEMQGTDENGSVSPHGVLLAITLFFLCGIVISEAFMAHQRSAPARATGAAAPAEADEAAGAIQVQSLADVTARTAALSRPNAAQPAAEAAQAGPTSASAAAMVRAAPRPEPGPAPVAAPAQTQAAVAVGVPLAQASVAPPRRQAAQPPRADAAPAASSAPAPAGSALTAQQRARCTELLSRFSLGETLQPSDRHYLGTTCH